MSEKRIDVMDDEDGTWFFAEGKHAPSDFIEAVRSFTGYGPSLAHECPWATVESVVCRWALVVHYDDGYGYTFTHKGKEVTESTTGAVRLTYVRDDG